MTHSFALAQSLCVFVALTFCLRVEAVGRLKCLNRTLPRVAIVNDVPWHYEIVAGFLHVLSQDLGPQYLDVYLDDQTIDQNPVGSWDLFKEYPANYKRISNVSGYTPADAVITISPEYNLDQNKAFVKKVKPKQVLVMVHNGEDVFAPLEDIREMHPNVTLVTLAPHVANFVTKRLNVSVGWMLPIHPFRPTVRCTVSNTVIAPDSPCVSGFVLQGNLNPKRRNYASIWQQLQKNLKQLKAYQATKQFHMQVIGRISRKDPEFVVPGEVQSFIQTRTNLNFRTFYDTIHHAYALVPSLASAAYYTCKFSSTVITSLSTETPVIATQQLLDSYTFMQPETVFLQPEGKSEIDVMLNVMQLSVKEIYTVRARLLRLRVALNLQAKEWVDDWLTSICPPAPGRRDNATEHVKKWTEKTAFYRAAWSNPSLRVYKPA